MGAELLLRLVAEHGPWVLLVFYLLYRDMQKETAMREALDKNTAVLIELSVLIRERLNGAAGAYPNGGRP